MRCQVSDEIDCSFVTPPLPGGATSCTDTGVTSGTYTYRVVAVFHSWTARSAESAPVAVDAAPPSVTAVAVATTATGAAGWLGLGVSAQ